MTALSIGARGPDVASLQKRLHELGYAHVLPDGAFGPATQAAVGDLQQRHGLEPTGKVGARLAALIASPDVLPPPRRPLDEIDTDEVRGQMPFITAALGAPDHAARRLAAAEGFMTFGPRFMFLLGRAVQMARAARDDPDTDAATAAGIAQTEAALADLEQADVWFLDWLHGERFTDNVEEPERRADVAAMVLDEMGLAGLTRVAIDAMLELPDGHPKRNLERARAALLAHLCRCRILRDHSTALATIRDLIRNRLLPPADSERLIREGEWLLARVDDVSERRNFWVDVFGFHLGRAYEERDRLDARSGRIRFDDDDEVRASRRRLVRRRVLAEKAIAKMEALLGDLPEADRARVNAKNQYGLAGLYGLDQPARSVELLKEVLASGVFDDETNLDVARLEAKQRLLLGEWQRACELLEPRVDDFERRFLAAVEPADIDQLGGEYLETLATLAWAHVEGDRWDRLVLDLGRGRGIRLRYRAALRNSPDGMHVLALERRLHALERGLKPDTQTPVRARHEDWVGVSLSERTAALEALRRARQQASIELSHPDTAALGAALPPGEAVVLLGLSYRGLLMVVVRAGDRVPSGRFCRRDWPERRVVDLLVGSKFDGWVMALGGRLDPDPDLRTPLERTLRVLDRVIGKPLGEFARTHGITQLTIVPDPWLDFVPLWALSGLSGLDVGMASSLDPFIRARAAAATVARALVVSNPTGDLEAAGAEGDAIDARLVSAGVQVERLHGTQATVSAVVAALPRCELLHFAGHGRSVLSEPLRSALELHPDWARAPVASGQQLVAQFQRDDIAWQQPFDEIREATIEGIGYLRELRKGEGFEVERWLDYGEDRTLWASGDDGEVVADLWTAGAMTVSPPLASTRCAFLSTCSSGGAFTPSNEGASGLVAALQLAGVDTVISTRWEIADAVGLLLADLFYEALCGGDVASSVAGMLRKSVSRLRKLTGRQAAGRLRSIAARSGDARARTALETFADRVAKLGSRPFAHPYYWAAFHVSGRGALRLH